LGGSSALTASVIVALVACVIALGAWSLWLKLRAQRLHQELIEALDQLGRIQKLGSLGEMAASFAHAFNDVLTPIIGRTQLLTQRLTDPQLRDWVATIERSALGGAQTVKRIQEFMRLRREETLVPVDLGVVLQQSLATTSPRHRPAVRIEADFEPVPPISGDPLGLREAFGHLIVNAVDAVPEVGSVVVATRAEDGQAVVSITDTGSGMSQETQARVFEPFFTTKPGATGLGLCLAHGIVARHGGQIEIVSTVGRGTTVRVIFPSEGLARTKPAAVRPAAGAAGGPARCLVVDDDTQVRDMIRDILSNAGHKVVVAIDGSDGVERFKADPSFDVIITDLAMPKLNGLQLARVCKTLRPNVPVVMLTGWGVLLTEEELSEHGVDEVLSKPVRMDQVINTIATVRQRAAGAQA